MTLRSYPPQQQQHTTSTAHPQFGYNPQTYSNSSNSGSSGSNSSNSSSRQSDIVLPRPRDSSNSGMMHMNGGGNPVNSNNGGATGTDEPLGGSGNPNTAGGAGVLIPGSHSAAAAAAAAAVVAQQQQQQQQLQQHRGSFGLDDFGASTGVNAPPGSANPRGFSSRPQDQFTNNNRRFTQQPPPPQQQQHPHQNVHHHNFHLNETSEDESGEMFSDSQQPPEDDQGMTSNAAHHHNRHHQSIMPGNMLKRRREDSADDHAGHHRVGQNPGTANTSESRMPVSRPGSESSGSMAPPSRASVTLTGKAARGSYAKWTVSQTCAVFDALERAVKMTDTNEVRWSFSSATLKMVATELMQHNSIQLKMSETRSIGVLANAVKHHIRNTKDKYVVYAALGREDGVVFDDDGWLHCRDLETQKRLKHAKYFREPFPVKRQIESIFRLRPELAESLTLRVGSKDDDGQDVNEDSEGEERPNTSASRSNHTRNNNRADSESVSRRTSRNNSSSATNNKNNTRIDQQPPPASIPIAHPSHPPAQTRRAQIINNNKNNNNTLSSDPNPGARENNTNITPGSLPLPPHQQQPRSQAPPISNQQATNGDSIALTVTTAAARGVGGPGGIQLSSAQQHMQMASPMRMHRQQQQPQHDGQMSISSPNRSFAAGKVAAAAAAAAAVAATGGGSPTVHLLGNQHTLGTGALTVSPAGQQHSNSSSSGSSGSGSTTTNSSPLSTLGHNTNNSGSILPNLSRSSSSSNHTGSSGSKSQASGSGSNVNNPTPPATHSPVSNNIQQQQMSIGIGFNGGTSGSASSNSTNNSSSNSSGGSSLNQFSPHVNGGGLPPHIIARNSANNDHHGFPGSRGDGSNNGNNSSSGTPASAAPSSALLLGHLDHGAHHGHQVRHGAENHTPTPSGPDGASVPGDSAQQQQQQQHELDAQLDTQVPDMANYYLQKYPSTSRSATLVMFLYGAPRGREIMELANKHPSREKFDNLEDICLYWAVEFVQSIKESPKYDSITSMVHQLDVRTNTGGSNVESDGSISVNASSGNRHGSATGNSQYGGGSGGSGGTSYGFLNTGTDQYPMI